MTLGPSDNPFLYVARPGLAERSSIRYDIRVTADVVEGDLAKGHHATDEMLLEAVGWFDPPLIRSEMLPILRKELDPRSNRAGRPAIHKVSLADVVRHVSPANRPDLPPLFHRALLQRLQNRRRYTGYDRARPLARRFRRHERDTIIRDLYRTFSELAANGQCTIETAFFGTLPIPEGDTPRSTRIMQLVQNLMRELMGMDPPGLARMANIASRNSVRFV